MFILTANLYIFHSSIRLPPADGSPEDDEFEDVGHSVSRMSHGAGNKIAKAAIAGLVGETSKGYEPGWKRQCLPEAGLCFIFRVILI